MKNILYRILFVVWRVAITLLMIVVFIVGLIPYMIYMKWLIPCPACGKRGTLESKKRAVLKTRLRGRELSDSWLYFVCRNCGKIRKDMNGTWHDVGPEEWEMVKSNAVIQVDPLDELGEKPAKKLKKRSRSKSKA